MKNVSLKRLLALSLSALIIATLLVPMTTVSALTAAPSSFPAPIMSSNPELLKEFAKPDAAVVPGNSEEYVFTSKVTGTAVDGAPVIATITEQAGPGDSISIYGTSLEGAEVYAYGLENGKGVIKKLLQTSNKDGFINAIINDTFDYTMYTVWVQGSDGKVSAPVRVNAPKLTWIGDTTAKSGTEGIRIYGKFLTTNNADGENAKSYVYLTNGTNVYEAIITEATPYRLTVDLPSLKDGKYKVWVHNGHGGEYGFSNSLDLKISSSAGYTFSSSSTVTVNPGDNLKTKISNAADGSTIYIKNGVYAVTSQISITKKLRIVGESKDGVIIVGVFNQSGSGALAYGDLNVNASRKAAFYIKSTRCEISNLTFADYVKGAEYCQNITAPSGYSIDYAHGMFIEAVDPSSDTGVTGQLKVDNCNFKIRRIHSDTNCIYFQTESERETKHKAIEAKYGTQYYSRTAYGSAPMWIDANRTEISNCYFETPKEIILRQANNSYIHDNTFVGTWVISGNSGPSAIHDNYTENLDISNNRIMGKDEITDPNGYVVTYDQTYARTLVFQKTYNVTKNVYLLNNHASRVGELDFNSGEHILFEDENVTYVGKATLSNSNKTLQLKDMPTDKWTSNNQFKGYITGDDGTIKPANYTRSVAGQVVIISKGKGQGQWRTILSASSNRTITIDRAWDVQPDANSTFVVVSPVINAVVYGNKIEGPKLYYKNFNSTLGVNAYASMVGTVIDRNNFSQMQAGLAINPHYNMKSYTYNSKTVSADFGFVMFADLLVMGNTIKNTRYGIWNFPSITLASMDVSTAEAAVDLQLCSVIRNNNISDSNRLTGGSNINNAVTTDYKKRGGVSIVVGRDYWANDTVLSTRSWMNNVVVENNVLSDVENNSGKGFIDVGFSQSNTILRNNLTGGVFKTTYKEVEVERNSHRSGKKPQAPNYYLSTEVPDETDYGAVSSGGSGSGSSGGWGDSTPDEEEEEKLNAETLAWLINLIITDGTDSEADFNADGNIDLLDVVFVKKELAGINYGQ